MVTLEDLFFTSRGYLDQREAPAVDPFSDEDALLEAQIIEIRYDAIRSALGVILEMRLAERIGEASTALLTASGLTDFSWKQVDREDGNTAWTIIGSVPKNVGPILSLELIASPSASLSFTAQRAAFYSVRIGELENAAPPDYVDQDMAEIRNGVARWSSEAEVIQSIHFG